MSDQIVHDAYARVRSRYTDEEWFTLPPRTITDAIYREMRQIDAERLSGRAPPGESTPISSAAA
jgi:hypothetical protein